jgi:hypothetical protein
MHLNHLSLNGVPLDPERNSRTVNARQLHYLIYSMDFRLCSSGKIVVQIGE